jgi:hypothetical protein
VRGQVPGKLLLGHALTVGGYGAALRTMTDGSLGRHLSRRIDESGQSLTPPATTYSVFTVEGKFSELRLQNPAYPRFHGGGEQPIDPVRHRQLSTTSCGGA